MSRVLRWSERALLSVAVLCLGYNAWVQVDATLLSLGVDAPALTGRAKAIVLGRLEIERLGLSAVVLEGEGEGTLLRGVGHIAGTALPQHSRGNVGVAGHRDTFFRALEGVNEDDVIELDTPDGTFRYRVEWSRVVAPDAVEVLAPTAEPALTLVTCYPFRYIGPAPLRFIVRGTRI
jgi:sortase A